MKSERKMPRDRDREVKSQQNSREFSRNETLAGYCPTDPHIHLEMSSLPHRSVICFQKLIVKA